MKRVAVLCVPLALLTACVNGISDSGDSVHERIHRTLPAAAIHSIRVENVTGPVTIMAGRAANITLDATKSAGDIGAIRSTQVEIRQDGSELIARTNHNGGSSGWFSHNEGASVAYVIHAPANVAVEIMNVSGSVTISGMGSDVRVNEVSGPVRASIGTITANRRINVDSVSGSIIVAVARNSNARVEAKTVSGAIQAFFPADTHKGFVGSTLDGRLGNGEGSLSLGAVSGSITVTPE